MSAPGGSLRAAALVLALVLTGGGTAAAHRLNVFAFADGANIRGEVYFTGGGPARSVRVVVLGPAGESLGDTLSGADGTFVVEARERVDHRIVADTGDGHQAQYVVRAGELPLSLPERTTQSAVGDRPPITARATPPGPETPPAELEAMVDRAVGRRLGTLSERLVALEQTIRWRDVLGGLGYIFGITGVACYMAARRRSGAGGTPPVGRGE